ncbi:hypothetical protein NWF32_24810 [Pseudomonas qingdaonensis]|nr:hypothetical protein [Pseudomonas qingdaonensis]
MTLVIWLLAAISMFVTGVVATHRVENRQNHAELQRSKAVVAAEGGLSLAVWELLQNSNRFPMVRRTPLPSMA